MSVKDKIVSQLDNLTKNQLNELLKVITKYQDRYLETFPMIAKEFIEYVHILDYSQDESKYVVTESKGEGEDWYDISQILPIDQKKIFVNSYIHQGIWNISGLTESKNKGERVFETRIYPFGKNMFITSRNHGEELIIFEFNSIMKKSKKPNTISINVLWEKKFEESISRIGIIRENIFYVSICGVFKLFIQDDGILNFKIKDVPFSSEPRIILSDGVIVFSSKNIKRMDEKGNLEEIEILEDGETKYIGERKPIIDVIYKIGYCYYGIVYKSSNTLHINKISRSEDKKSKWISKEFQQIPLENDDSVVNISDLSFAILNSENESTEIYKYSSYENTFIAAQELDGYTIYPLLVSDTSDKLCKR